MARVSAAPSAPSSGMTAPRRLRAEERAARLLQAAGLLPAGLVLERGLRLVATRRSRAATVSVHLGQDPLFMVKLGRPEARDWIEREILCYRALDAGAGGGRIAPALVHSAIDKGVLVTDLIEPAETLHALLDGRAETEPGLVSGFGSLLARVHATMLPAGHPVPPVQPWVLVERSADRDAQVAALFPDPAEQSMILGHLADAAGLWRTGGLIHGDAKLDNCLLSDGGGHGTGGLHLVDWELAGLGDLAWDLATALQEFMLLALATGPATPRLEAMLSGPAEEAMVHLHRGYLRARGLQRPEAVALERRASVHMGARMVQSAFEFAAFEGAESHRAQGSAALALDLCRAPEAVARCLDRAARDAAVGG